MKIADEKGRLFGKINIIDLLVMIVVLAAVCFALFRYVLPGQEKAPQQDCEMVLFCHDAPKFTAEQVKVGDKVWDQSYDVELGTVKSVEIVPLMETQVGPDGKSFSVESDWLVSVVLVLDTKGVKEEHGLRIDGSLYASGHTMTVFAGEAKLYLKVREIR